MTPTTAPARRRATLSELRALANLIREVSEQPEHKTAAHYAAQLAELFAHHDLIAQHPKGTAENKRLWSLATTLYDTARKHATKYGLPHPREALREAGYDV